MPKSTTLRGEKIYYYDSDTDEISVIDVTSVVKEKVNINDCPPDVVLELVKRAMEKE